MELKMKAAYLAHDKNSLASISVLANYFEQIDFYLVDPERKPEHVDLNEVSLLTEHLMIPAEEDLRTQAHVKALKFLQNEWQEFRAELHLEQRKVFSTSTEEPKTCRTEIHPLALVKDVVISPKTNEIFIEREKTGITTYDFLFTEDHQIMAENYAGFAKHVFRSAPQNSHIWLTVEFSYELKKPRDGFLGERKFIFVKDRLNRSILDNWYFIRLKQDRIAVQQWVPFNQYKNSDFQKFIIERIEKILKEKLDLIQINEFKELYIDSTPGFEMREPKLKNTKISSLVPSFHFLSQDAINRQLYNRLDAKMKELHRLRQAQVAAARGGV
jgi:hypothetical protein